MRQLGISDHKSYVKKQLSNETLHVLNSTIISKRILDRLEADIDECVSSKTFLDLQNNLPSVFNKEDISSILQIILSGRSQQQVVILDDFVISKQFVENLNTCCEGMVQEKAERLVEQGISYVVMVENNRINCFLRYLSEIPSGAASGVFSTKIEFRSDRCGGSKSG